jgi:hypothetical protein
LNKDNFIIYDQVETDCDYFLGLKGDDMKQRQGGSNRRMTGTCSTNGERKELYKILI